MLAVHLHARLGTAAPPFAGRYRIRVGAASLLAPMVAAIVVWGTARGIADRLPWRRLLLAGYLSAVAWALGLALVDGGRGLAGPVTDPGSFLADSRLVRGNPLGYLRGFVASAPLHTPDAREHPPGPGLLLWALGWIGVHRPVLIGLLITLVGCLAVPFVAIAVRSLCHETAARRLVPLLALAPYALWVAVSMDAVTLAIGAGMVACGVLGSERGRRPWWAVGCGLLLGGDALFSYSAPWLGFTVVVVYFVRRRPLLNVVTGVTALVPLSLARAAGFIWPDGLRAAQAELAVRVGPHRSWLVWTFLDLLVLAVATGPAIAAGARKLRRTPGWPFLVGTTLAVGLAIGSGLSRGDVERSWLVFYPWLLVPAVAAERRAVAAAASGPDPSGAARPAAPAADPAPAAEPPVLLLGLGALAAIVLEAILRSPW
ncbi:MAG TPA: hypothetical protein VNE21_01355 [Mycobacteriales bacterium]|nr:hypothetical protein [Mycobacteriales bacterium]